MIRMEQVLLQVTVLFNQLVIFMEFSTKVTPSNFIPFMIPKPQKTLITMYAAFNKVIRDSSIPPLLMRISQWYS